MTPGSYTKATCPHCHTSFRILESNLGRTASCSKCQRDFTLLRDLDAGTVSPAPSGESAAKSVQTSITTPTLEKSTGTCDICGKKPRVRRQIEGGRWVCQACLKVHGFSVPEAPTSKQLAYAERLGIQIPPRATRRVLSNLITLKKIHYPLSPEEVSEIERDQEDLSLLHEEVMFYVMDMWQQLTGKRPKQVGIPWPDQQLFAAMIVMRNREIARGCVRAREWVEQVRNEKVLEYAQKTEDWSVDQEQFKPPLPHDESFQFVSTRARERWNRYLPLLKRLFGSV